MPPEQEEKLQQLLHSQKEAGQQTLYHLPHMNLWTKLRPGVHVSKLSAPRLEANGVLADLPADTSALMPKGKGIHHLLRPSYQVMTAATIGTVILI